MADRDNPGGDGAGKHLRWRADDLVASELGYRSRTLGWYWAIRLHGAPVSSFRVRLSRTGRGGMSVLGRMSRKAVAAALFHKNNEKRVTILLRGLAASGQR